MDSDDVATTRDALQDAMKTFLPVVAMQVDLAARQASSQTRQAPERIIGSQASRLVGPLDALHTALVEVENCAEPCTTGKYKYTAGSVPQPSHQSDEIDTTVSVGTSLTDRVDPGQLEALTAFSTKWEHWASARFDLMDAQEVDESLPAAEANSVSTLFLLAAQDRLDAFSSILAARKSICDETVGADEAGLCFSSDVTEEIKLLLLDQPYTSCYSRINEVLDTKGHKLLQPVTGSSGNPESGMSATKVAHSGATQTERLIEYQTAVSTARECLVAAIDRLRQHETAWNRTDKGQYADANATYSKAHGARRCLVDCVGPLLAFKTALEDLDRARILDEAPPSGLPGTFPGGE